MANNQHFDILAPLYDRVIRPPDPAQIHSILELPAPGWVLDAAGGTGRVASILCPLVERLVISDLSFAMLAQSQLKQKNGSCHCIAPAQGRVERLPFPDGCFSRILVVDAYHHFSDQTGAVRELVRVLQPGGLLVIEEPDIRRFAVKLIALAETLALMDSHFRTPDFMKNMLTAQGLEATVKTADAAAWVIGRKSATGRQP